MLNYQRSGTVSLATLRRAAEALDADFVYAVIPRKTVRDTVRARARQLAEERVLPVAKSIQLEAQGLNSEQLERRIEELARDLETRPRELWRCAHEQATCRRCCLTTTFNYSTRKCTVKCGDGPAPIEPMTPISALH
jgi:hypothetical protein